MGQFSVEIYARPGSLLSDNQHYILSQKHEGWSLVPDFYDDGGFSGGSMERPALRQLLQDIEAGKVHIIVVYKVDRLTRSLADFAKIVDVLDAKGASFVSVTQAFNTTTSMGRLTLNVLLSFAQFEREVTGERIRDKIAASKKKGLWMGGPVPLGYEVRERKLHVVEAEATTVRDIMQRYLRTASAGTLIEELERAGIRTKVQHRVSGPHRGGIPFRRGSLYHLLKNPIYRGFIVHKGKAWPGEHEPIVDEDLWNAVQQKLAENAARRRTRTNGKQNALLAGLLHDGLGRRMTPSYANRQGKRYRYYITHAHERQGNNGNAIRVPAHDLEQIVIQRLRDFLRDDTAVQEATDTQNASAMQACLDQAYTAAGALAASNADDLRTQLRRIVARVDLHDDHIDVGVRLSALMPGSDQIHTLSSPVERLRRGHVIKLVFPGSEPATTNTDSNLIDLLAEAHAARQAVLEGKGSLAQIAARLGRCRGHLADRMRQSYLAPDIVAAILEGRQPRSLTRKKLLATPISADWEEQRRQLGFI
ncbi:recombinase family protein [Sphingosinicella sp.]|uniref:recombinase family protein n=1 Tax=Sphingosinicella sp. TaxID=1917971 RepID=UPI002633623B|nr:recombinase family protein [Sphingosinicella sp.]